MENRHLPGQKLFDKRSEMVFLSALKMKTAMVATLKHTPADGRMSIWQRNCFEIGVVGSNR